MEFIHEPVLLQEVLEWMDVKPDGVYCDGTLGGGGHSGAMLRLSGGTATLYGIDRDMTAIEAATARLRDFPGFHALHGNFHDGKALLMAAGAPKLDGVLLDLGVSSPQLDRGERGFSYHEDAPLDMRMDVSQPLTAERILATYDAAELVRIFKEYGEERFSRQIARAIVARRDKEPFTTTAQLNRLVDEVVPQAHRPAGNPAKRVFQALRIEVNGELDKLASTLPQAANRLHVGGRLVVESYHSLEDKTVKSFMAQGLRVDVPAGLPVIPPDAQPFFTDLTRGAIKADEHEIAANPRSASVRLRAVEVSREIPSRWRKRFTQTAQGLNDVKIQGSASPGRAKNTARIRTRRG